MIKPGTMTIEHEEFTEVFEPGCFGKKDVHFAFKVERDEWEEVEKGRFIRRVIKAKLYEVSTRPIKHMKQSD